MTAEQPFVGRAAAVVLAAALAVAAVLPGVQRTQTEIDVDEHVYRNTLRYMRDGLGYYPATERALIDKEGAPPRTLRAVRPPAEFLLLRWFPERSWRWLAGIAYFGIILGAFCLGRPYGRYGGAIAALIAFVYVIAGAHRLYLHPEFYGAPFFILSLLEFRRGRDAGAAASAAAATVFRELYWLALAVGLVLGKRKRPWIVATVVGGAVLCVHWLLATDILSPSGRQAPFGREPRWPLSEALGLVTPTSTAIGIVAGMLVLGASFVGMRKVLKQDRAAALLLPYTIVMVGLTLWSTRSYWTLTFGPAIAAFVPAAFTRKEPATR